MLLLLLLLLLLRYVTLTGIVMRGNDITM